MEAAGVIGAFVVLGLIGVLIGRNKDISLLGAFVAGWFGIFGWVFLLLLDRRPEGEPRESSSVVVKAAADAVAGWVFVVLAVAGGLVFVVLGNMVYAGIYGGPILILSGEGGVVEGLVWLGLGVAAFALLWLGSAAIKKWM